MSENVSGLNASGGKKPIARVGTTPTQPAGGLGVGYKEIRHNVLTPGNGFLGGGVGTQGGSGGG